MATYIKIGFIFLSTTLCLSEAYSGIRHRRSKMPLNDASDLHKNELSFNAEDTVGDNDKNSESTWRYHYMKNHENKNVFDKSAPSDVTNNPEKNIVEEGVFDNEKYSNEGREYGHEKTVVKRAFDFDYNEPSSDNDDSWVDLVITFAKLANPFLPRVISELNLDWSQVEVAARSFSHVSTSDISERSLGKSPLMTTIRATTNAATPLIMDGVRELLRIILNLIDDAGYAINAHPISRRGVSESVLDDVMDGFTAVLEHMTGSEYIHEDIESL